MRVAWIALLLSLAALVALAAGALALWAIAKSWSLVTQVWRPNEYSDAYYYFLQCRTGCFQ